MIAFLARIFGGLISSKTLLSFLVLSVIGVIFYNLIVEVITEVMQFALTKAGGAEYQSITNPTFSGFAGWFIAQMKIPESVSVIGSAVALKFVLRKIPFIKW